MALTREFHALAVPVRPHRNAQRQVKRYRAFHLLRHHRQSLRLVVPGPKQRQAQHLQHIGCRGRAMTGDFQRRVVDRSVGFDHQRILQPDPRAPRQRQAGTCDLNRQPPLLQRKEPLPILEGRKSRHRPERGLVEPEGQPDLRLTGLCQTQRQAGIGNLAREHIPENPTAGVGNDGLGPEPKGGLGRERRSREIKPGPPTIGQHLARLMVLAPCCRAQGDALHHWRSILRIARRRDQIAREPNGLILRRNQIGRPQPQPEARTVELHHGIEIARPQPVLQPKPRRQIKIVQQDLQRGAAQHPQRGFAGQ